VQQVVVLMLKATIQVQSVSGSFSAFSSYVAAAGLQACVSAAALLGHMRLCLYEKTNAHPFTWTQNTTRTCIHIGSCEEDELSLPDGGCWRLAASVDDDLDDSNGSESDSECRQNVASDTSAAAQMSNGRAAKKWFSGSDDAMSRPESQNPQPSDHCNQRARVSSTASANSADFVRVGEWTPRESLDDSAMASTPQHRISQGWLAVGNALQSSSVSDTEL
jgi:hypothetical protein